MGALGITKTGCLQFLFQNKNYTTRFLSLKLEATFPVSYLHHAHIWMHLPSARPDTMKCGRTRNAGCIVEISWVTHGAVRAMTGCRVL
jgi:hypothetical protein